MKPLKVEIWRVDRHGDRHLDRCKLCASHQKARRWAEQTMGSVLESRYGYRANHCRRPFAQIVRRNGRAKTTVEPLVHLVRSCGDRGWW